MNLLGQTEKYRQAMEALLKLKKEGADEASLKAIAEFLLYAHDSEAVASWFPYLGDASDPRDRAVVEAYNTSWKGFIEGDELPE